MFQAGNAGCQPAKARSRLCENRRTPRVIEKVDFIADVLPFVAKPRTRRQGCLRSQPTLFFITVFIFQRPLTHERVTKVSRHRRLTNVDK